MVRRHPAHIYLVAEACVQLCDIRYVHIEEFLQHMLKNMRRRECVVDRTVMILKLNL